MASLGGSSGYFGTPDALSFLTGPPAVIADRYVRGDRLGVGSFGQVFRAVDRLTGNQVAIKLFDRDTMAARVRREVVALRALRLPGVVWLLDEGVDQGWPFLVMELIDGQPFPGSTEPISWPELEPAATSLLEVLGRVHEAGALHLDLKPPNVMVTGHGSVVLLDLGLAGGPALGGANPAAFAAGTAAFIAPEQYRSGNASPRSDLFSTGVMLYRALSGHFPYQRQVTFGGRVHEVNRVAVPLAQHAKTVPTAICTVIDELLAQDPDARPASAWRVLERLDAVRTAQRPAWAPRLPDTGAHLPYEALAACFHGPERLLHIPSDAADQLYRRTGGIREHVQSELRRWLRLGLATAEGERLRITRAAIDQLESMHGNTLSAAPAHNDDQRLRQLIAGGHHHDISRVAAEVARAHLLRGRRDQARTALEQALLFIRRGDTEASGEAELLTVWAEMALEQRSPAALDLALYQLGRAVQRTAHIESLDALVRSALFTERGETERAHAVLDGLPPFSEPDLEIWRHAIRLRLAAKHSREAHAAALAAAEAWAQPFASADIQARLLDWRGRLAYERHAFAQAAELQERAAALTGRCSERLSSLLNSASAYLEAGNYAAARGLAEHALALAAQSRLAHFEGRAEWLLRAIAYRSGAAHAPDLELVDAAAHLDIVYLQGLICLGEAAITWRYGDSQQARALAAHARECFQAANLRAGMVLAHALELACTAAADLREEELAKLARDVIEQPLADIDWQVLGMLAHLPGGSAWQDRAIALANAAPRHDLRRELLAPSDVLR